MSDVDTKSLFDLSHTIAAELFEKCEYPWQILDKISEFIIFTGNKLPADKYKKLSDDVWVSNSATVSPSAFIKGPCIIEENSEIRHCAYIRGSVIIGKSVVVGNSTEIKNSVLFDNVQVPHYNYIGDSVLGWRTHLGAGAITSNVKGDKTPVIIHYNNKAIQTGRKKLGAIIGDDVEIGCNTVLNPGTIIGKNTQIYPLSFIRGYIPPNSIYKSNGKTVKKH